MIRCLRWLPAVGIAAACLGSAVAHARVVNPQGFSDCDDLVERHPDQRGAYACYYAIARMSDRWFEGRFRLEVLLARDPENPWIHFALGSIAADHQGPTAAEPHFRNAIERLDEDAPPKHVAIVYLDAAELARELGNAALAQYFFEEAESAAQRADKPELLANVWSVQARHMLASGGDRSTARQLSEAALGIWESSPSYSGRTIALSTIAALDALEENPAAARARWMELSALAAENDDELTRITAEFRAAVVTPVHPREHEALRDRLQRLASEATEAGLPALRHRIECATSLAARDDLRIELARACREHRDDADAQPVFLAEYALAMALARQDPHGSEARTIINDLVPEARSQVEEGWKLPWLSAAELQLAARSGDVDRVLALAGPHFDEVEFYRARQNERTSRAHVGSEVAGAYYLVASLHLEQQSWGAALDIIERARNRDRLARLKELDLEGVAPRSTAAVLGPALASAQAHLEPDEAVLSFQVADLETDLDELEGGSWLAVVLADDVFAYRLDAEHRLESETTMLAGLLPARDDALLDTANALSEGLLGPMLERLPRSVERLHIVVDGPLHRVPFEALRISPAEPFLAERFSIDYAASISDWVRSKEPPGDRPDGLLALALTQPTASLPDATQRRDVLGPLPRAEDEARSALAQWQGPTTLLAGKRANATSLETAVADAGVVHFATHAIVDDARPSSSAIVLEADPNHDGLLGPADIANMDFSGRVVVLSACRSAEGQALRGEGVLSLATAFMHAGAEAVVASRWPLLDADAHAFFDRFYTHLTAGSSVASALRSTRRDRIAAGAPAEAWAGVIVLGNGDLRPLRPREDRPWAWALAALGVLGFAIGARALSRRRSARAPAREDARCS